jgi:hypothetical protein
MAKIRDQAVTSQEIENYLNSQDDFALEMQVYSLATSLNFEASHGGTYQDPVTKKPRQYDIRAHVDSNDRRIDLAIECKSLKASFPLVVSRIPRDRSESYHQVVCSFHKDNRDPYTADVNPAESLRIENRNNFPLYPEGEPVGKATTQIGISERGDFISGDAEVYDKWSQALSSLSELASDASWYRDRSDSDFYVTALLPILVIPDGTLWVADYDTLGTLTSQPRLVDQTSFFLGRDFWSALSSYNVSHLHICTLSGLKQFMSEIQASKGSWEKFFPIQEIDERLAEA